MNAWSIVVSFALSLMAGTAWATTRPKPTPSPEAEGRESLEYQRALAKIELQHKRGVELSASAFRGFNWVGRTAAINYACSALALDRCRELLEAGIEDRALVVRDHSLRLILASEKYLPEEKKFLAQKVIDDSRNYRGGVALWIVERARKYLEGAKG